MTFYKSLLQIVGNSKIMVINLDSASMTEEVATCERSVLFDDLENYVETPIESSSIKRTAFGFNGFEVASNFDGSMRASKGAIYRMFSQMDLNQLKRTFNEVTSNAKELSDIDLTTTWRQFGVKQTMWSLNLHNHVVFEKLCSQILSLDREQDENVELVERILACLCMSTRTMQISQSTKVEDKASKRKSLW